MFSSVLADQLAQGLAEALERDTDDEATPTRSDAAPTSSRPPLVAKALESRLVLLRRRLELRCPPLALAPRSRGVFILDLRCQVSLTERASASA